MFPLLRYFCWTKGRYISASFLASSPCEPCLLLLPCVRLPTNCSQVSIEFVIQACRTHLSLRNKGQLLQHANMEMLVFITLLKNYLIFILQYFMFSGVLKGRAENGTKVTNALFILISLDIRKRFFYQTTLVVGWTPPSVLIMF